MKKQAIEKVYRRYNLVRTKKFPLDLEIENLGDLGENNFSGGLGCNLAAKFQRVNG